MDPTSDLIVRMQSIPFASVPVALLIEQAPIDVQPPPSSPTAAAAAAARVIEVELDGENGSSRNRTACQAPPPQPFTGLDCPDCIACIDDGDDDDSDDDDFDCGADCVGDEVEDDDDDDDDGGDDSGGRGARASGGCGGCGGCDDDDDMSSSAYMHEELVMLRRANMRLANKMARACAEVARLRAQVRGIRAAFATFLDEWPAGRLGPMFSSCAGDGPEERR